MPSRAQRAEAPPCGRSGRPNGFDAVNLDERGERAHRGPNDTILEEDLSQLAPVLDGEAGQGVGGYRANEDVVVLCRNVTELVRNARTCHSSRVASVGSRLAP